MSHLQLVDVLLPLVATFFIGFISLKTLDHKQQTARQFQRDGLRVPWHLRRMLHLSRSQLRADMVGRCVAFFLIIMAIQIIKAYEFSLLMRLIAALLIATVLLLLIPRLFVAVHRRLWTT